MLRKYFILVGVLFLLSFLQLSNKAQTKTEDVIKVDTALVNIPVIVSDRNGRYISGLGAHDFKILEDGNEQKIEYFINQESPINVALILDTSLSTKSEIGKIKKAAREFLKQLQPSDRGLVVSFDSDVEVLCELTSDKSSLEKAIKKAEIGKNAGTVLQDAVFEVVNNKFANIPGRKAIILLTDGKDFGSNINKKELIYRLQESDTLVYSIFYETEMFRRLNNNRFPNIFFPNQNRRGERRGGGRRQNPFPDTFPRPNQNPNNRRQIIQQMNEEAISFLEKIADSTAGRVFQKDVNDLDETFKSISDELRKQYLIGYYPDSFESAQLTHQVRVKVNKIDVVVRAKNTYRIKKL